jgi:hypothetical protein
VGKRWLLIARTGTLAVATAATAAGLAACGFDGLSGVATDTAPARTGELGAEAGAGANDGGAGDPNVHLDPPDGAVADGAIPDTAPPPPALPASCTDVPAAANTDVTLYVAHDMTKPWGAYCGPAGETYLRLPAGAANNYSSYPDGNCASQGTGAATSVKTTWTRVRIDPVSFLVTTNDYAGSTSTGSTREQSGNGTIDYTYVKMPFATGRTCENQSPKKTVAKVDLTGTKFRVVANFLSEGFNATGSATTNAGVTTLAVNAYPGGMHSCGPGGTDYYQRNGGKCLQLEYVP